MADSIAALSKRLSNVESLSKIFSHIGPRLKIIEDFIRGHGAIEPRVIAGTTAPIINEQIQDLSEEAAESGRRGLLVIPSGLYTMTEDLVLAENIDIEAAPDADLDFSAITGIAPYDNPSICGIRAEGVISTDKINTVLSGNHYPGDRTLSVVDAGDIEPNDWIFVETTYNQLLYKEMHQVVSVVGNVITTKTGLRLQHLTSGTAHRVVQITPVKNIRWRGGRIRANGGTLGAGFLFRGARNVCVDDVVWSGFTRSAIMLDTGTETFRSRNCYNDGETNSSYYAECSHDISISGFDCNPDAELREHAVGYARHQIIFSHGVVGGRVSNSVFRRVNGGIRVHSGSSFSIADCKFYDLDPTRLIADGVTADDLDGSNDPVGICICGSYATIEKADWADGVVVTGIIAEDIFTPNESVAFEWHDWRACVVNNVSLINNGQDPNIRRQFGHRVDDLLVGCLTNFVTRGIEVPLKIAKTPVNLLLAGWKLNGTHPAGSAQFGIELALTPGLFTFGAVLRDFMIGNFSSVWRYTGGHPGDIYSEIVDFKGSWSVTRATQWFNAGGSIPAGAPVVYTAGGSFRRVTATGAQARKVMVVTETSSGDFVWCSELKDTQFVRVTGTVNIDDFLETDGAGGFVQSLALVDDERARLVAMETHSGGGYAPIRVRCVV